MKCPLRRLLSLPCLFNPYDASAPAQESYITCLQRPFWSRTIEHPTCDNATIETPLMRTKYCPSVDRSLAGFGQGHAHQSAIARIAGPADPAALMLQRLVRYGETLAARCKEISPDIEDFAHGVGPLVTDDFGRLAASTTRIRSAQVDVLIDYVTLFEHDPTKREELYHSEASYVDLTLWSPNTSHFSNSSAMRLLRKPRKQRPISNGRTLRSSTNILRP